MSELLVSGEISLPAHVELPAGAVAHVQLLDVSLADAPAAVVAEEILDAGRILAEGGRLRFALYGAAVDARRSYEVSVHVDADRDGRISRGDYISQESYPVITYGYSREVVVRVLPVG